MRSGERITPDSDVKPRPGVDFTRGSRLDANFWKGSEKFVTTEFAAQ
jgi:hypothetical protein